VWQKVYTWLNKSPWTEQSFDITAIYT
jgi:hypothetical protein